MMRSDSRGVVHAEMGTMTNPLIDASTLAAEIDELKLFDLRWMLGNPEHGKTEYQEGHIPGAVFVNLDTDLSSPPGISGRHPLPEPATFRDTLGRIGISPRKAVVVYDDTGGTVAARLWWMLRSIGHENVRVLNGGVRAWTDAGGVLETGENEPLPALYPGPITFKGVVEIDGLWGRKLVDVRAPERYRGETEPVDPRPGHIPGAVNLPAGEALVDGQFDVEHSRALYGGLDNPVMSCGSGVNACHSALAMVAAGFEMPEIYVGSYSEWSRSDRPVVLGPVPE